MTERYQVYRCSVCGNIVEMLHPGVGDMVCCGKPMILLSENTVDASKEKHVPVMEKTDSGIRVRVGAVPHPMEEKHFIEWVEVITADGHCRQFLKPGAKPEAEFNVSAPEITAVREHCNLHGLWKA